MVNPAFPKKSIIGVFNLELARMYAYLYQNTDVNFTILHSFDGYDEFLDQSHKDNYQHHGRYAASRRLWCFTFKAKEIEGGTTIEDLADMFIIIWKRN
jgi:anthranilate phosphoribosyltransferase